MSPVCCNRHTVWALCRDRNEPGSAPCGQIAVTCRTCLAQVHVDEANHTWNAPRNENCSDCLSMIDEAAVTGICSILELHAQGVPAAFMSPKKRSGPAGCPGTRRPALHRRPPGPDHV